MHGLENAGGRDNLRVVVESEGQLERVVAVCQRRLADLTPAEFVAVRPAKRIYGLEGQVVEGLEVEGGRLKEEPLLGFDLVHDELGALVGETRPRELLRLLLLLRPARLVGSRNRCETLLL